MARLRITVISWIVVLERTVQKLLNDAKVVLSKFRLLWVALKKFNDDHGFFLSAGITFNLIICLVPFLLLLLALMGTYLYSDRAVLNHIRQYLENVAPSLDPRIMKNILRIIRDRKIVGILGIAGLIWTSTWVFSSLRIALNIIFEVEKGRGIVRGKVIDLLMIFLVEIFLLVSMTVTSLITYIQGYRFTSPLDIGPVIRFLLKYAIPFFFSFWMFFLILRSFPIKKFLLNPLSGPPASPVCCGKRQNSFLGGMFYTWEDFL